MHSKNIVIITKTLAYFFLAGLFEIGGGYLIWLWIREDYAFFVGLFGGFVLFLYGIALAREPARFNRTYAAYGGIFIVMAMLWGWIIDGIAPDRFDVIGATIALAGVAIIFYWPRKEEQLWQT